MRPVGRWMRPVGRRIRCFRTWPGRRGQGGSALWWCGWSRDACHISRWSRFLHPRTGRRRWRGGAVTPRCRAWSRDARHISRWSRCLRPWTKLRGRCGPPVAPRYRSGRRRGRPREARNEVRLLAAGIIEAERPAQRLEAVSRERLQHFFDASLAGTGQSVDELRLDAAVGDLQPVEVETGPQLAAGQFGKHGALRRHGIGSLFCPPGGLDIHGGYPTKGCRRTAAAFKRMVETDVQARDRLMVTTHSHHLQAYVS